jgi:Mrp family chromosome partitioning ATPase
MLGVDNLHPTADEDKIVPVQVNEYLSVISMALLVESRDTPIIWRGPMKMKALQQFLQDVVWGDLDYLVVDLPPGTGDEPLSIAQLLPPPADAVVVTTPQEVALLDSRKTINFASKLGMNVLGVVENMSGKMKCPNCGDEIDLFGSGGGKKAAEEFNVDFLGAIPIDPGMIKLTDAGLPALADTTPAGKAIDDLVERISSILESP